MHRVGDHQALLAHAAALADLLDLAVEPDVRVAALERALAEHAHLLVQSATQPGDGVLADPGDAELLDESVDLARGDAVDVGLLHDRDQRLLGAPARLQEAREVAPAAQLRDRQLDLAGPRLPRPRPITVAMRDPLARDLAELGADLRRDLGLHQLADQPRDALAHDIDVLAAHQLVDHLRSGHPPILGHRGASLRQFSAEPTILRPAVADPPSGPARRARYTTSTDSTTAPAIGSHVAPAYA